MTLSSDVRSARPVYARCPACHLVTAPLWEVRDGAGVPAAGRAVLVGCGYCGHEHRVERAQAQRAGAVVRHGACGTVVACPPEAHLVRCQRRGPDSGACGELFAGPAAAPWAAAPWAVAARR